MIRIIVIIMNYDCCKGEGVLETIVKQAKCTGCKACADACLNDAISYKVDKEGFWYPKINRELCIDCGKCQEVCPQVTDYCSEKEFPKVYSAWNKNEKVRLKSTSGGIFFAFAREILIHGGYVVGCQYDNGYKSARHVIVHDIENLQKIIGSKYFQSDTGNIYIQVQNILKTDSRVLFCGTPCQIAALYKFLGKTYENLITIDFICLGINSPKAFSAYVCEQEKKHNSPVAYIQLKNKIQGWQSLATYMEFENGEKFLKNKDEDLWIQGFIKHNLYMRPSCYHCQYRKIPRVADISLGDFWGIENVGKNNLYKGVSAVMVNSKKGTELFEKVKDDLRYKESNLVTLKKGNPALEQDAIYSAERKKFFDLLEQMPFSKAVKKSAQEEKEKVSILQKENYLMKKYLEKVDIEKYREIIRKIREEKPMECLRERGYIGKIDIGKFIYYNYFLTNISRDKKVYIIPYKNCIIDIDSTAQLYVYNRDIELGINKLRKSKAEVHFRMGKNAKWISNGGAQLNYNTVLEICASAKFESGYFTANSGSAIVCAKHIIFGEDVMLGRNLLVYDSDHHQILDERNHVKNKSKEVIVEGKVWLTSNVTVLKGVHIGEGSIVGAQTVVTKDIPPNSMVIGGGNMKILHREAKWSRKTVK